jgi:hypothetical protein
MRISMRKKTYRDAQGYLRFRDSRKLVHRWRVEKNLRRKLRPNEVVHHKNKIKIDNRTSNLRVFDSNLQHRAHHAKEAWGRVRRPRSQKRSYK